MKTIGFRELIEAVRGQTDIVKVVGQYVRLDRHNKALCPFHDEKTPSFSVDPKGQFFHCFGCGVGGDVFRFLQLHLDKSFWETLSDLAREAGIPLHHLSKEERQRVEEGRTMDDILAETTQFYHRSLTPKAKEYLTDRRGVTEKIINGFQIGYANGGLWEDLLDKRRLPLDLCLKAGVLKKVDGAIRDYFYRRIIFPNLKRRRVVHMTGRRLDDGEPKYLHLPGKIRYLYNEDSLSGEAVYVTEGIPDCLSAIQEGYPTVAILGSSGFKPEYLPKFSRCETIHLCLDGDEAGVKGALKIGGLIGERARIVQLPEGSGSAIGQIPTH